jgi:phosphinothricin acetyltransferase
MDMPRHGIRAARADDLAAIVAIYNHYVATTHFTFDVQPYTTTTRQPWFAQFDGRRHRCLVLETDGTVLGYASAAPLQHKAAYATSVEVSVYLEPNAIGAGRGAALYTALFAALANEDVHRAYALIALPNTTSIALHRRFGFTQVAHLHEVGRKFDEYWDVAWFEKPLP